jgi:hypothetical protein
MDWVAELEELDKGPGASGCTDYSQSVVMGGGGGGGAAERYVERRETRARQVAAVELWLNGLSPLERQAADYWLQDENGTITEVARAAGLEYRRMRWLAQSIPLLIWGRFYDDRQRHCVNA